MKAPRNLSILMLLIGVFTVSILAVLVFADAFGPLWQDNSTNVSSGAYYSPVLTYDFGINWTNETNGAPVIRNVTFETNLTTGSNLLDITQYNTSLFTTFTNNTTGIYNITFTSEQLAGAGTYVFRWYANDTPGNRNASDQWTYTIAQNPYVNLSMWLNGTASSDRSIEYPSDINITCKTNISSQNTFEMYRNGTKVGTQSGQVVEYRAESVTNVTEGVYNFTCYYNETRNYSSAVRTQFLTVKSTPMWSANSTTVASNTQYTPDLNFSFKVNWTDLANNLDNVTFETNLTTGGSLINITKASTNLYTNFTNNTVGDVWWVNFTQEQLAGAGTYAFRWYAYDVNDSWNKTDQWVYVIAKNTTKSINVSLYINGTESSALYNSSQRINITAALNVSEESVSITTNFTGWSTNYSGVNKTTMMHDLLLQNGSYAVTAYYIADVNYSVNNRTVYVNVSDMSAPQSSLQAQNASTPYAGNATNLTVYWRDPNLAYAILETNETGSWENKTGNYTSPIPLSGTGILANFTWQNSSVSAGTVVAWRVYANDSLGYWNVTDALSFTLKLENGASCSNDIECIGGYCCISACQDTSCPSATTTTTAPGSSPPIGTTTTTTTTTTTVPDGNATTTTTTLPPTEEMILLETVAADGDAEFEFTESDSLKIKKVTITTNAAMNFMAITIKEGGLPSGASAPFTSENGSVYKYLNLTKDFFTDDNITAAKIEFKVEKSWVETNGIDHDSIALFRFDGTEWEMLDTSLVSDDATYYHYEADTTKMSVFAIGGLKTGATVPGTGDGTTKSKGLPKFSFPQIIIIIGIIIVAIVLLMMKLGVIEIVATKVVRPKRARWAEIQQKYKDSKKPKKEPKKEQNKQTKKQ